MYREKMRRLAQNYTEAVIAYSEVRGSRPALQTSIGTSAFLRRLESARSAREEAWLAWKSCVTAQ
jgi:hypothetical protein